MNIKDKIESVRKSLMKDIINVRIKQHKKYGFDFIAGYLLGCLETQASLYSWIEKRLLK